MQRAMGETACTKSVPCCGFAGRNDEAGAAPAGSAKARRDKPATGQRADETATRINLTGNIPHFLSGFPGGHLRFAPHSGAVAAQL